jgi:hypothetical protein
MVLLIKHRFSLMNSGPSLPATHITDLCAGTIPAVYRFASADVPARHGYSIILGLTTRFSGIVCNSEPENPAAKGAPMNKSVTLVVLIALLCCTAFAQTPSERKTYQQNLADKHAARGTRTGSNPLIDHGGPVDSSSVTYAIYWGTPSDFPADLESGMAALLAGFTGSSYLGIAKQYMRGAAISTRYGGALFDSSAPPSNAPKTSAIGAEVCKLVANPDPNGIYIVFTSNAPNINYCAWHDRATCNGVTFQVAYIPNQAQLLSGCSPYIVSNLGCNSYSEGTVASADSVAHEFMEAVTDPHLDAWYDQKGYEVADKCNFVYQSCVKLGRTNWQIQEEWSNAINGCQQQ